MLHTINKSPFEKDSLKTCLRYAEKGSSVLFIEDAVYACTKGTNFEKQIADHQENIRDGWWCGLHSQAGNTHKHLAVSRHTIQNPQGVAKTIR